MKGDKGICSQIFPGGKMINKTKFDTIENCKANIKNLQGISVLGSDVKPYKCMECNMFHSGKPQERKDYGIH